MSVNLKDCFSYNVSFLNKFHILTLGEIILCVITGQSQENEGMRIFLVFSCMIINKCLVSDSLRILTYIVFGILVE